MSKKTPKSLGGVALPPGSFDLQKLDKELGKSVDIDDDAERRDSVSKALEKQDNGVGVKDADQGTRVDQKRMKVTRKDLGTEEYVRTHDAGSDAAKAAEENAAEDAERMAAQAERRAEAIASTPQP